uniref:Protein HAIKU1-like n=1 Tax=Nelumbo nucifera TaxID=4432 RepID=A0A822XWC9_NELNU|nr:TPA_asm: hypothetical protein HUJ06_025516 [Nelumbo nucifera]
MDNSNFSKSRHTEHLGVNKLGRPPQNPPKPPSMRLQKIRPPPLTPINRPQIPPPAPAPPPPFNNNFVRPGQLGQPLASPLPMPTPPPFTPGDSIWSNTAESPISAYMRYLQNSIIDSGPRQSPVQPRAAPQPQVQAPVQAQGQAQAFSSGLLPTPPPPAFPSPRANGPALLPSPTSPFPLPSPSSFLNLLSPRSPYPLPYPGFQYPISPNFSFSPLAQSGILGPGPQPPLSPGFFPPSPSGFFPISSPRWRNL